jgi:hypothetical protein
MSNTIHIGGEQLAKQAAAFDAELAATNGYRAESTRRIDDLVQQLNGDYERDPLHGLKLDAESIKRLEGHTREEAQKIAAHHAAFTNASPPAALVDAWRQRLTCRGAGKRAHLQRVLSVERFKDFLLPWLPINSTLTPPAVSCDSGGGSQCNEILGDMNLRVTSSGGGGAWGLLATAAGPPDFASLRFVYVPPVGGDLYITARVDVSGTVYVVAHDHWYTSTRATAKLTLGCRLFQQYREDGDPLVVVDENRTDSSAAYWVIDSFYPTASTTVNAGVPVLIDVWATLDGHGHSDHAKVDCDFASGADHHIRVPAVDLTLVSF